MNKTVLVLFSAIFIAVFTSCGEVGNNGGGSGGDLNITGNCGSLIFDDATQFCGRDNKVHDLCSGDKYDTKTEFCFEGGRKLLCGNQEYNISTQFCLDDEVFSKCGGNLYEPDTSFCFVDKVYSKCNGEIYNANEFFCYDDKVKNPIIAPICGNIKDYNPNEKFCNRNTLYPRCGDMKEYDPSTTACCGLKKIELINEFCCFDQSYPVNGEKFCHDNEIYDRCGRSYQAYGITPYNPSDSGCFENRLYVNCKVDGIIGKCSHNKSLLRCKQLGNDSNYVIDPLPGMTCNPNGAITGEVTDVRTLEKYKVAQIGNQIWLAEDLKYIPTILDGTNDTTVLSESPKVETITTIKGECYDRDTKNFTIYGRMYDWATAMKLSPKCNGTNQSCPSNRQGDLWQGLCPPSFGFPKKLDWDRLINYAGGDAVAGGRLKSASGWSYNGNGTDDYGFNALSGGYYTDLIEPTGFKELGSRAMWWVDDQKTSEAYYTTIISSDTDVRVNFQQKGFYKAYVRCVHYY